MSSTLKKLFLYSIFVYVLFGFIAIPLILKSQLTKIIEEETYSKVDIGGVYFNPFIFELELSDVTFKSLDEKPLLSFKEFMINVQLSSLVAGAVHLKNARLVEPAITLVYNKDKSINLLNILKHSSATQEQNSTASEMPRVILDSIEVIDGKLEYEDFTQAKPFEFSFGRIGFELKDVDTNDFNSSNARVRFYTTLGDGGFVDFRSQVVGFKPFAIEGSLDFEASKLYTEWKYAQEKLNLEVADGKISFHALYHFNLDKIEETKIDNLNVSLESLRIKPKNKYKDVLNLESFYVTDATIMPLKHSVLIDEVGLYGLGVKAKRDENGTIDWMEYIKLEGGSEADVDVNVTEEKTKPWDVTIESLALEKISLYFTDSAIKPEVISVLNSLNIYAQDITLAGEKPFRYEMNLLLNSQAKCTSSGSVRQSQLEVLSHIECHDFDVTHYNPYIDTQAKKALKTYDLALQNAIAGFDTNFELSEENSSVVVHLYDANISLDALSLNKRSTQENLLGFKNFRVTGVDVDTQKRSVAVADASLNELYTNLAKSKDGSLNVVGIVKAHVTKKIKHKSPEEPFSFKMKHFGLNGAKVGFVDNSLSHKAVNTLDKINANVYDIDLKKGSWLSYNLSLRVNKKGSIQTEGKLRHSPLKQSGTFDIRKISLAELTPYLQEKAYVRVDDGKLSLKGSMRYQPSSKKPDLRVQGSLNLASLFVNDTQDNSLLLSLSDVEIKSYTFELNPNRLYIDEVNVNAFFVNAMIDENKVMNFTKLMKVREVNNTTDTPAKEDTNTTTFPVRVVKINYALGSAKFSDYSIPLKFRTHIHDLNGVIYSISNIPGDTTYVDISGEVDEYGSTRLKGSIDSSAPRAYTDMDFNFKNLELNAFSGYSATFAGHEIDSGKLYLDLGYDILNSQLHGTNTVMIKKIELGKEVEDENVTKLPLHFVIGLLEDSDGIIDIDMPVEGNLDEPDFKYGKLVLQTVGNLITKAVTSPFKFLGSVMGVDGEKLEFVSFELASSVITPPEREKLDLIAKIMLKKPKISLGVNGAYNASEDKERLQRNKLIDMVVLKSGITNIKDHESVMTTDMLESIYKEMRDDNLLKETKKRLSSVYKDEEFDRVYQNELIKLCSRIQLVSEDELLSLANQRAEAIVTYLTQDRAVSPERVSKKESRVTEIEEDGYVKVDLQIEVK